MNQIQNTYKNESGVFVCDKEGTLLHFEPEPGNIISEPIVREVYSNGPANYEIAVYSLIIPEGVIVIPGDFFRYGFVKDIISFPKTLSRIGDEDTMKGCTFANTCLPDVVIPSEVQKIGSFAFGDSRIRSLRLQHVFECAYLRQFKGAKIEKLVLPKDLVIGDNDQTSNILRYILAGSSVNAIMHGE